MLFVNLNKALLMGHCYSSKKQDDQINTQEMFVFPTSQTNWLDLRNTGSSEAH